MLGEMEAKIFVKYFEKYHKNIDKQEKCLYD
jgi:hypothetical protein